MTNTNEIMNEVTNEVANAIDETVANDVVDAVVANEANGIDLIDAGLKVAGAVALIYVGCKGAKWVVGKIKNVFKAKKAAKCEEVVAEVEAEETEGTEEVDDCVEA